MGKRFEKAFARIFVGACYRSVGSTMPPEINLAIRNGTPFKVSVTEGTLFASINGVPLVEK